MTMICAFRALHELDELNRQRLRPLLRRIEQLLQSHVPEGSANERQVQEYTADFEESRADLRREYEDKLLSCIEQITAAAHERAGELAKVEVEGARAWSERTVNWVRLRAGENQSKLEQLTLTAWQQNASRPSPVALAMPEILAAVTQQQLNLKGVRAVQWGAVNERVGALEKVGNPSERMTYGVRSDLDVLTGRVTKESAGKLSGDFGDAIRLLPAMSLSWAMVSCMVPELVAHDAVTGGTASAETVKAAASAFDALSEEWREGIQMMVNAVAPIGLAAGTPQGRALIGAALHGSVAATAALSFIGAGAAIGATALAIQVTNSNNRARISAINQAINLLAEREYAARMKGFDDLMDKTAEILNGRLRRIYRADEEVGKRDLIARLARLARFQSDDLLAATSANIQSLG